MKKPDISKVISKLRRIKQVGKAATPVIKPPYRERDMRRESIDMGSHQAEEFFGGGGWD